MTEGTIINMDENIFRSAYRPLLTEEVSLMNNIKEKAFELYKLFPQTDGGRAKDRETSLAITKLEESIMWVVKSITR